MLLRSIRGLWVQLRASSGIRMLWMSLVRLLPVHIVPSIYLRIYITHDLCGRLEMLLLTPFSFVPSEVLTVVVEESGILAWGRSVMWPRWKTCCEERGYTGGPIDWRDFMHVSPMVLVSIDFCAFSHCLQIFSLVGFEFHLEIRLQTISVW